MVNGSLARFLLLPSDESYPDENLTAGTRRPPTALVDGLKLVAAGGGPTTGNLAGRTAGPETAVEPHMVPMAQDARDRFRASSEEITAELRAATSTPCTAILARIAANATKLARIHPASGIQVSTSPTRVPTPGTRWRVPRPGSGSGRA